VGLFALPEADPRQLAMLSINPPTAALLLNESIDLRPGDWVAQNAANSGVGRSLSRLPRRAASRQSTIAPFDLIAKRVVVKGFFLNHPDVELKIPSAVRETAPLVASGVIRVPIAATYSLTAFREAVAHVQRGGKVMFDVEGGI
jgi:NADPH:quinone reductase-like Zn-dependent oxidoreductase